jgi:RNA polymerase sigma-70 factor (ECF subfamily)
MSDLSPASRVEQLLDRLRRGDASARDELLLYAEERLLDVVNKFYEPDDRIRRWADTDEVAQLARIKLWEILKTANPDSTVHFRRLIALAVRRTIVDLARHLFGPNRIGNHYRSGANGPSSASGSTNPFEPIDSDDPSRAAQCGELHRLLETLPDKEKAVVDLIYYNGLSQEETAAELREHVRTVQRRFQRARRKLGTLFIAYASSGGQL